MRDHVALLFRSLTYHVAIGIRTILEQQIGGRYSVGLATRRRKASLKGAASEATPRRRLWGLEDGRESLNGGITEAGKQYVRSRKSIIQHSSDFLNDEI